MTISQPTRRLSTITSFLRRSRGASRLLIISLFALLLVLYAASASAFCRTTSCDRTTNACSTDAHGCVIEGAPLFWPVGTVDLAVDSQGSPLRKISKAEFETAVAQALSMWTNAACEGGGHPALHASTSVIDGASVGYDPKGPNDNVVILEDGTWPYAATAIGKTMIIFGNETGEIFDADIALNSGGYPFALNPDSSEADLVGVLTHEIGHVLGLDHSDVPGATMQPETQGFGTPELRTLEPDDVEGICAIYPPPPGVVSSAKASPQATGAESTGGSCAVGRSRHSTPHSTPWIAAGVLLFILGFRRRWPSRLVATCVALLGASGCYPEKTVIEHLRFHPAPLGVALPDGGADAAISDTHAPFECPAARSLEPVPARSAVMTAQAAESSLMSTDDLYLQFKSRCGTCHVAASLGGFHTSAATFPADMNRPDVLDLIYSNDPTKVMPEGVGAASSRDPKTDPYLMLGALLKAWYAQGRPANAFALPTAEQTDAGVAGANLFRLTTSVGKALTNIGNCIPSKDAIGVVKDKLDAFFESATELPPKLQATDVTTFDSEALAEHGVVAFAPGYPLWADGARKIRYVRVPRGKSIEFDKANQEFVIPDHTRFYKTFLRKVIEKDGSEHYRKMETRLIVASQTAPLFGSYQWNREETEATLVTAPLNDLKPFTDTLLPYITDEAKDGAILAARKAAGDSSDPTTAEVIAGAIRHYAIPGSDRCVQCHMGSPSRSFVLGFTPLQINRRKKGEGGTQDEDAPGDDELSQLQRLIDYGVITGIKDPSDILPLEKSEGTRTPRNDYELAAQGYMVGNCAHCHNPNGYPSVQNPVLASGDHKLDFLPGPGTDEGIFQFPLEKFSPRINRDFAGSVQIPYITPSLVDYPGVADFNHMVERDPSEDPNSARGMVLAPWRSLIYRNVDTPFPYSDDVALFPHMPMNTPGFDCRLPRIIGDWMVSIPAVRKHPDMDETLVQAGLQTSDQNSPFYHQYNNSGTDTEFQPYTEVPTPDSSKPDLAGQTTKYDAAQKAAAARLVAYHVAGAKGLSKTGNDWSRYNYCPETTDITDWTVTGADRAHLVPSDLEVFGVPLQDGGLTTFNVPVDFQPFASGEGTYTDDTPPVHVPGGAKVVWPAEGVPDRPHWVVTDTTDTPPPWTPRRDDWTKILRDHEYQAIDPSLAADDPTRLAAEQERAVVEMLNPSQSGGTGVRLTQAFRDYATTLIPYGLWKVKSACQAKLAAQHKASEYQGAARPKWMDVAAPQPTDPVYTEYPGAAVFNMVCINCHGPLADSHGRQADTLQLMTGGFARVANLRDGLFGPTASPGANRKRVYDATPNDPSLPTFDDWGARYMSWMALGGTQKLIPRAILNVVASTPIFGVPRSLTINSANMLGPVQTLCAGLSGVGDSSGDDTGPFVRDYTPPRTTWDNWLWNNILNSRKGRFITSSGDPELWASLCSMNNPTPVAVIRITGGLGKGGAFVPDGSGFPVVYYAARAYPAGSPLGNDRGGVDTGFQPGNTMPWCIKRPEDPFPPDDPAVTPYLAGFTTSDGKPLPLCPSEFVASDGAALPGMTPSDLTQWSYRGAINAGLAVFLYLDKISNGYQPVPAYDQCESLP